MKIGILGLGLIGGSMAKDLKSQIKVSVVGIDNNRQHCDLALSMGLVNEIETLEWACNHCDALIVAVPVDVIENLLPSILDSINDNMVVIDVGSTKAAICNNVRHHPKRGRYVAAHPLAGTEFSGPEAALRGLFNNKKNIICESNLSDPQALKLAIDIFESLGMYTIFMDADEHDRHLAYVSHLSHVSSFMLGLTVLNIEKDERQIFDLAGTGFESTVRLAKSNPNTWAPIFQKNKSHISEAIGQYISLLNEFKAALDGGENENLINQMTKANDIRRVLKN